MLPASGPELTQCGFQPFQLHLKWNIDYYLLVEILNVSKVPLKSNYSFEMELYEINNKAMQ